MFTTLPKNKALLAFLLAASATWASAYDADSVGETSDAADASDSVVALDQVDVNTTRADPYAVPEDTSIGKSTIPVARNPQAITVVPRALLDDISAVRLEDAIRGVAGVQTGGYYNNWDYFRIRGFAADFNTYIDGLRGGNGMGEELFGLEQLEVVKGPAALYGSGPLGGLVNLLSKRPTDAAFTKLGVTVGSYGYYESTLDFNQPLNADKTVLFRLSSLYREQESAIDNVESRRVYVAPSVTWKITPATSLTILSRYRDFEGTFDMPLPAAGTVLPNPNGRISSDFYTGVAGSNQGAEVYRQIGYSLTHEFSENVKFSQNFRYDRYKQTWEDLLYPWYFPEPYNTIHLLPYDYYQKWNDTALDTRVDATIEQGRVTHQLTAGVDYFRKNLANSSSYGVGFLPLNLYQPDHDNFIWPAMTPLAYGGSMTEITGLYLQDHLKLPGNVTITVGGRYDFTETSGPHDKAFTPRAGGTWEFAPGMIAYASYSEAFNPQSSASGPLDPETGDNREAGLRSTFLGGRLATTVALYQVTRQNVATADSLFPEVSITTGEQRSRGIELDARYAPVKGWEILAAYAYTDTEITADNTLPFGARMAGVPLHTFDAWTKYTQQAGPLRGLGFGLGATYYSSQDGDRLYATRFELPGYLLWKAALYYDHGPLSAQLNVTNLFDKEHYAGAYDDLYVMPGEPRLIRASVTWKF